MNIHIEHLYKDTPGGLPFGWNTKSVRWPNTLVKGKFIGSTASRNFKKRTHSVIILDSGNRRPLSPFCRIFFFALLLAAGWNARAQDVSDPLQTQAPQNPPPNGGEIPRQEENKTLDAIAPPERWNLFWQATSIGQYHGTFPSPYEDAFSLQNYPERDVSLTTTLFFGLRLGQNTQFYFNPEIAGGRGFSGVNGLANSSNGELPRVASAEPKPYIARLYVSHDFGFGTGKESFESEENQLAGERPMNRYTVTVGRFTLTDFFDDNRYSHDPRAQFIGWAVMYNGAWDYPADVRGYTWGWVHELHTRHWSIRYASAAMPKVANGSQFDRRIFAIAVMWLRKSIAGKLGSIRVPFAYWNTQTTPTRAHMPRPFSWRKKAAAFLT